MAAALDALGTQIQVLETHRLAFLGHMTEEIEHEAAHRVPLRVGEVHAEGGESDVDLWIAEQTDWSSEEVAQMLRELEGSK